MNVICAKFKNKISRTLQDEQQWYQTDILFQCEAKEIGYLCMQAIQLYNSAEACLNRAWHFNKTPYTLSQLIKESGYEAQQSPLFYVFATVFSLDCAQTTIGFEFCLSN